MRGPPLESAVEETSRTRTSSSPGPRSAAVPAPNPYAPFLAMEQRVREFWARENVPERALALHPTGPPFRFTEGPPTANGRPHVGHLMARSLKDMVLRFRRMNGYRVVTPMAGWDCHGLPVEIEVEKSHGWRSKKQILEYGLAKFAADCRTNVLTYEAIWRELSSRMAYWLDYSHAYFTMSPEYIESVWWSLKELHGKSLLEKGLYVVPYCPRCETPEASHEVAQGYRETTDPSVTVRLRRTDGPPDGPPTYLLAWTTTPWTLPANLALAVGPAMDYVVFPGTSGERYVMAAPAFSRYFPEPGTAPPIQEHLTGADLVGWRYEPPFPGVTPGGPARHRVYAADWVSTEEGTGIVHVAPSFGVDDHALGQAVGLGAFDPLDASGHFTSAVPLVAGLSFKAADAKLLEDLSARGLVHSQGTYRHTYPFCWRCGSPLMYRAVETWFIRIHKLRAELVAHNAAVNWIPAHLREGRFGNFLSEAKDWALSRNRYWGTPLPFWECPRGHWVAVGSFAELRALSPTPLPEPFDPHRPWVDEIPVECPEHHVRMTREPYVIDVWYDSGSAPFAQYHYPFAQDSPFDPAVPLDFVAEGLDQTRGWFYTLHVLATLLFHRPAYRTALVNGMALDEGGLKMSKSKRNVVEPLELMDRMGADAPRLAIYLGSYTESTRFSETSIRLSGGKLLTTLLNVVEFYRSNAALDGVRGSESAPDPSSPLDRWLLSRLERLGEVLGSAYDASDAHTAAQEIQGFLEELSTWYLRRSRPRFWSETSPEDKRQAYATLSYVLIAVSRFLAPLAPHAAEHVHQVVRGDDFRSGAPSVHLEAWPRVVGHRDTALEGAMARLLTVVEGVRDLRMKAGVRSRIPLPELVIGGFTPEERRALGAAWPGLLQEEANVKKVTELTLEEFAVRPFPEADWVVRAQEARLPIALSRNPGRELWLEGLSREIIRRIQMARKESGMEYGDRVRVELWGGVNLRAAARAHGTVVAEAVLAAEIRWPEEESPPPGPGVHRWDDVEGETLVVRLEKARGP